MMIRAHLHIGQASMTGRNTLYATAAGVVDTIKQVCYIAVAVVAVHNDFHISVAF